MVALSAFLPEVVRCRTPFRSFRLGASVTYTISATVGSELQSTIDYLIGVTFAGQGQSPTGIPQLPSA